MGYCVAHGLIVEVVRSVSVEGSLGAMFIVSCLWWLSEVERISPGIVVLFLSRLTEGARLGILGDST